MAAEKVRVLIVDDSAICRSALRLAFESDPEITVVGEAGDGMEAVRLVEALKPSLVTMDLQMPRMGGLDTIELIMRRCPTPILVVTDRPRVDGVDMTFASLSRGALDLLPKATSWRVGSPEAVALVNRVKQVAREVKQHRTLRPVAKDRTPRPSRAPFNCSVIGMGASTGGPSALATVLRKLARGFPVPILVVQHMEPLFQDSFVQWLAKQSPLPVAMAVDGEDLKAGEVRVAPQGTDLVVEGGRLQLRRPKPGALHVPSVDRLFRSLAEGYGSTATGVLLTGMGRDGAEGLRELRQAGSFTLAQDQASSAVWGMPAAAVEIDAAELVLPLQEIAAALNDSVFRTPANVSSSETGKLPSSDPLGTAPMNKQKILLVDDSRVILEAGRLALEDAGFDVSTLENPLSLAAVIRKTSPDLVLLDVNMPAVTGDVVARIIGRHGFAASVKLVLYSDISPSELKERAERCGARGFIRKTGDEEALVAAVKEILGNSPRTQ